VKTEISILVVLIGFLIVTASFFNYVLLSPAGWVNINEIDSFDDWCSVSFYVRIRGDVVPVVWTERLVLTADDCRFVIQHGDDFTYSEFLDFKDAELV